MFILLLGGRSKLGLIERMDALVATFELLAAEWIHFAFSGTLFLVFEGALVFAVYRLV